jgi:hypothetical protein
VLAELPQVRERTQKEEGGSDVVSENIFFICHQICLIF